MDNTMEKKPLKPRAKPQAKPQQPLPVSGFQPEIWDGNNAGWTLVTYKRKKKGNNKK
jgi:hypothetical protein